MCVVILWIGHLFTYLVLLFDFIFGNRMKFRKIQQIKKDNNDTYIHYVCKHIHLGLSFIHLLGR